MMIDAHVHLWKTQRGMVNGRPDTPLCGGRADFGGEVRQMVPPYLASGENPAELLLSNMDFAGVNAAVVTQVMSACRKVLDRPHHEREKK